VKFIKKDPMVLGGKGIKKYDRTGKGDRVSLWVRIPNESNK